MGLPSSAQDPLKPLLNILSKLGQMIPCRNAQTRQQTRQYLVLLTLSKQGPKVLLGMWVHLWALSMYGDCFGALSSLQASSICQSLLFLLWFKFAIRMQLSSTSCFHQSLYHCLRNICYTISLTQETNFSL